MTSHSPRAALPELAERYRTWILIALAGATWVFLRKLQLSHDIVWQYWVARQMLGGARLYADIWEVNPPLWFWMAIPVEWLAKLLGIGWQALHLPLMIALGGLCAHLVLRLIDLGKPLLNLALLLGTFWVCTIVPLADLGQREHFALLSSLPYAALMARRAAGGAVSSRLALFVGVFAAFGFALKHYFVIVPVALEVWLWLKLHKSWRPLRAETGALAALAAAYAVLLMWLAPEFFTIALPMVSAAYDGYENSLSWLLFLPWSAWCGLAIAFLFVFFWQIPTIAGPLARAFFQALLILSFGFLFCYFVQHKGPYYHAVPAVAALSLAIGMLLVLIGQVRVLPVSFAIITLYLSLSTEIAIEDKSAGFTQAADNLFADLQPGETVFVAGGNPLFWPVIEKRGLVWPSRASSLWVLPAIANAELDGTSTPALDQLEGMLRTTLFEDLTCNPPARIMMARSIPAGHNLAPFEIRAFLLRDTRLARFIEENYARVASPSFAFAYARKSPIDRSAARHCVVRSFAKPQTAG